MAKIAVLDDDDDFISLMRDVLNQHGHEAASGFKATGAIELIEAEMPDLIVLDIMLGGGDTGINILTTLRLSEETRHIPVVICTGRAPFEVDPLIKQSGFDRVSVVYKPFDLDRLLAAVNDGLASKTPIPRKLSQDDAQLPSGRG